MRTKRRLAASATVCLLTAFVFAADTPEQKTFDTPLEAAKALVAAAANDDVAALLQILGPDGKDLVVSGDPVEDKNARARFAAAAQERMSVAEDPINLGWIVVSVGADDWPSPIPIVKVGGKWRFDSAAGRDELLARRIGRNELDAISLLRGYVEAQLEYAESQHDDSGILQYAQQGISTPGKQDGLFWRNPDGSSGGPIGDIIAEALATGYTDKTQPYNGYFFRILKAQGPSAPKGALDYVVDGAMIGGFAMVAWPAQYGVSGIQTFQVAYEGVVYQNDLGPDTSAIASAITRYDPDGTWLATIDEE